ncbi:GntR family transcriptional regulator [Microtetraspora sp. AC03309]|nr:GntR family transcriptional regulator [Microtetraspora sp. AC03309]
MTRPKRVQIYEVVRARIESGKYPPHYLISEVRVEGEFGVARVTIRKVTAKLRETASSSVTTLGMGSFVSPRTRTRPTSGPNRRSEVSAISATHP